MYTEKKSMMDELRERAEHYVVDTGDRASREGLITHLKDTFKCCEEVATELADEFLPEDDY